MQGRDGVEKHHYNIARLTGGGIPAFHMGF